MDRERFKSVCGELCSPGGSAGKPAIGTYSEKALHEAIKFYLEPDSSKHEVRLGPFRADICNAGGVTEIQTRNFSRLLKKLNAFLGDFPVTVVYPAVRDKYLSWIDPETGEISARRKSPKRGTVCSVLPELYRIKPLLCHKNFSLGVLWIDMEEFRLQNGWSRDKKRGSVRYERFPLELWDEIYIRAPGEYEALVPPELSGPFSSAEFARAAKLGIGSAQKGLNALYGAGALLRTGKRGNAYLYERVSKAKPSRKEWSDYE